MTFSSFTGIEYLKIDIASSFGHDKLDWADRIAWVDQHDHELEHLTAAADEPALYYAGVQAYRAALRGEPTGYPISLDAASSGLQILACLSGCEDSAKLCGVVSTGHREDAYMIIYQVMREIVASGNLAPQKGDQVKIPGSEITREDLKRAIMTSFYSSQAIPKQVFGEGELLQIFYKTMDEMAPGAWALNFALQQLWQPMADSHDWVMPDNFHAHVKVMDQVTRYVQFQNTPHAVHLKVNQGTKEGRSISPNLIHSIDGMIVREMHRRCDFEPEVVWDVRRLVRKANACTLGAGAGGKAEKTESDKMVMTLWQHYKNSGFLSARILGHLTADNFGHIDHWVIEDLLDSLPEKPFSVISIHDCFRCHPNFGDDLRRQYNRILSEIAASDMLAFLASQVTGQQIQVTKAGDISQKILEADYTLC